MQDNIIVEIAAFHYTCLSLRRLIVWCLTPFSTVFQLHRSSQCTYQCFPGILLTSTPHNILSKPLAAFPQPL